MHIFWVVVCLSLSGVETTSTCDMMESVPRSLLGVVKELIPKLSSSLHKGQAGRIAIVGGSFEYTGAPYYAAISSLKAGGDLAWVVCDPQAAVPIKSYSPEIIVVPALSSEHLAEAEKLLKRVHVLVIGSGLGRSPESLSNVEKIISLAKSYELPMVIDGDGLYLISKKPEIISGYNKALLTPNKAEFLRLWDSLFPENDGLDVEVDAIPESVQGNQNFGGWLSCGASNDSSISQRASRLARKLGNVTIMQKGPIDIISDGKNAAFGNAQGSLRRCGGQGDVLAGVSGLFVHWALSSQSAGPSPLIGAAFGASALTRTAAKLAFEKHGRSTTTPEIIEQIGTAFPLCFTSTCPDSAL
mmetsp:Transcript_3903/g.5674  ORF Transcript_3903/g.5674 Transcript_3903/m.5674 type:complete len:357 (-) Transcript_3903:279-1349(-)